MQNAAFHALGIDAEYLLYDVEPENLESFLKNATANNISGLNITIPHKIQAKEYLERKGALDENAKRLGAQEGDEPLLFGRQRQGLIFASGADGLDELPCPIQRFVDGFGNVFHPAG